MCLRSNSSLVILPGALIGRFQELMIKHIIYDNNQKNASKLDSFELADTMVILNLFVATFLARRGLEKRKIVI